MLCGSCWAFAATGVINSAYAIKYKEQLEFSEQQLLDCTQNEVMETMMSKMTKKEKLSYDLPILYDPH